MILIQFQELVNIWISIEKIENKKFVQKDKEKKRKKEMKSNFSDNQDKLFQFTKHDF